ncbi:DUF397 domain-containing protein [Cryptosporangium arvum]|uniref:DUF397 domain-containing protein n=1 Tax=Cryptosporangium arvum TaxID=80871 RepID=UPI000A00744C|nr:DUF397 domain-containing protein [Cryptosporangium arvum]
MAGWRAAAGCAQGNCVEVAPLSGVVGLRDGKNPTGPVLAYPPLAWSAFITAAKTGAFDIPR